MNELPEETPAPAPPRPAVHAIVETEPVVSAHDAADDAAIWIHPQDPMQSLIIGTDKQHGLQVYDIAGRVLQTLPDGRLNNVDLRDGFAVDGRKMSLVAASNRSNKSIAMYLLDPATGLLARVGKPVPTGFQDPYGLCMYVSPAGEYFVFVNDSETGRFRQWRVQTKGTNVVAERVREFNVGSQAEGCVADDATGGLYVAEEGGGFWRYRAGADGGSERREIDRVAGPNGLVADIEGVAIWEGTDGGGYVVLSNQGANSYAVYQRSDDNAFVGIFQVGDDAARGIDGTSKTDGIAVTSRPVGPQFPEGLMVIQDGENQPVGEKQNFKYVSWRDVARVLGLPGAN
jgi:3-phytase